MSHGMVSRTIDPENIAFVGVVGRTNRIIEVTGPIVEIGVKPTYGMIDDSDPVGNAIILCILKVESISNFDKV
jgi:hypothetical protein